ncbi:type I 3-dehydroquinate dehydratase [Clostridium sp. C105KSO13]|uniref:type I 3-dehydroquinate dehydratase n=1 Tax=Clostridium sp. C105KSO13 TaxID=1776045 RepID=UPI00074089A0|nr:type I 3-dehydroquinate dehydratase [Clostridium sp. C105KSO13]MDV9963366.1 type I 3-dehydroquinate dehydratase [Clostridioides difficile]CUX45005.1 3-dehydroquinate dehydratase [Clostridium sp. C105KSO13]
MNAVKVRNIEIGGGVPKICVPIVGKTKKDILGDAENVCKLKTDVAEWRGDWYEDILDSAGLETTLSELRKVLGDTPLLFTFRTSKEGGEMAIDTENYVKLNQKVIRTGIADMIDVELNRGEEAVESIINTAHMYGVKVIASNHDFQRTPDKDEMVSRLCRMQKQGADIAKIAVMPKNKADVLALLAATEEMTAHHGDTPVVTMSMSGTGVISRVCGEVFGSALTFGAAGRASAPGQMKVGELRTILELLHKSMQ